jgi:hypothetical protein
MECRVKHNNTLDIILRVYDKDEIVKYYEVVSSKFGEDETLDMIYDIKHGERVCVFILEGFYGDERMVNTFFNVYHIDKKEMLETALTHKVLNDFKDLKKCVQDNLRVI